MLQTLLTIPRPDAELIGLCDDWIFAEVCWQALNRKNEDEKRIQPLVKRTAALGARIAGMQATTIAGCVAKARVVAEDIIKDTNGEASSAEDAVALSLARDLLALGGCAP